MEANNLPTLESIREIIGDEAANGTGAAIITDLTYGKPPTLQVGFADLGWKHGPRLNISPHGMRAYRVRLGYGNFSRETFERMNAADDESHQLAISLIEAVGRDAGSIHVTDPQYQRWVIGQEFHLSVTSPRAKQSDPKKRAQSLSREIVVPILSALAELNGYDTIESDEPDEGVFEGRVSLSVVRRRERNPRNRLLAIKLYGTNCMVCGQDQAKSFGFDNSLVEVHHCHPLALTNGERVYDPKVDLVPLCPTCHRAAHRRTPIPFSVEELRQMLTSGDREIG